MSDDNRYDPNGEIPADESDTWERAPIPVNLVKPESLSNTEVLELLMCIARDRVAMEREIESYANTGNVEMMELRKAEMTRLTVISAKLRNVRKHLGTLHERPF